MKLDMQKKLAAKVLKVGVSRIWIDPSNLEEVSKAITRYDIKGLIDKGIIKVKPKKGVSRGRARKLDEQRRKGRRRGHGSRKGAKKARIPKKRNWINKVRPLRGLLKFLKEQGTITSKEYRELYNKIKGNFFRSKAHLKSYVEKMKGA